LIEKLSTTYNVDILISVKGNLQENLYSLNNALGKVQNEVTKTVGATDQLGTGFKKVEVSTKDYLLAVNNVATGMMSLYDAYDRVKDYTIRLDKANLQLSSSTNSLNDAQTRYTAAVEKYGPASDQAVAALDDLKVAQERVAVATERVDLMQENYAETMARSAMQVIPSLITTMTSLNKVMESSGGITGVLSSALSFLAANPITLVIAGVAALAVGVGAWINGMNLAAAEEKKFNDMMAEHYALMTSSVGTWNEMTGVIDKMTENLGKLNKKLEELTTKQADEDTALQNIITRYGLTSDQVAGLVAWHDKLYGSTQKEIDIVKEAIKTGEDQNEQLKQRTSMHELFFDTVTKDTTAYQKAVSDLAESFSADWQGMTDLGVKDAEIQKQAIQGLADQYNLSWDKAYDAVKTAMGAIKTEIETVPPVIHHSLIELAQAKFAEFQKCMSGKSLTLKTDVVGNMQGMSDNIVGLIQGGLVGEAQAEMQAYVNCSTSKMSDMVVTINGYMTELTTQHNQKMATLTETARTAFGAEKDAILAAIGEETAGYELKMGQLHEWQRALFSKLLADASSVQAGINAIMASAAASLANIKGDYAAASAVLNNLFAVTKSAKDVAALAAQFGGGPTAPPTYLPGFGPEAAPTAAPPELPPLLPGQPASYNPNPENLSPSGAGPTAAGLIGLPETGTPRKEAQPIPEKTPLEQEIRLPEMPETPTYTTQPTIINNATIQIMGSADKATAELAAQLVTDKLKFVLVEPSSSSAPATSKRIRPSLSAI
jgi:hypothetical protein